ncbi:hypothetical protein HD554DRAFT_700809 [Boletus coccyginus]|nr:hypothetical protein HD554DRAFT_700809 [Boletus coccyginus]
MLTAISFLVLTARNKLLCLWCWCPCIHAHCYFIPCADSNCCVCGVGVLASMLTAISFLVLIASKLLCLWCWCPCIHAHCYFIPCADSDL